MNWFSGNVASSGVPGTMPARFGDAEGRTNQQIAYVHLRNPKTSRFARRQHVQIDDPFAEGNLEALYGARPLSFKLFPATVSAYRRQWDAIMGRLEIPHSRQTRGSGATHLYLASL